MRALEPATHTFSVGDVTVAEYVVPANSRDATGPGPAGEHPPGDLPATLSPRPHLHPVRTLAGVPVTEVQPGDHPHHLGVSVAVPDVDGVTFWGGRTFVRGQGSTWLDNHGVQRHEGFTGAGPGRLTERLGWTGPSGERLLEEERTLSVQPLRSPGAWALRWSTTLVNATTRPLAVNSPATNGRPGAGYGGWFWRAPGSSGSRRVVVPGDGGTLEQGEAVAHGARTPWLGVSGVTPEGAGWTLVLAQSGPPDPWFVRLAQYPGFGPALAWDRPLELAPGAELRRDYTAAVLDGVADDPTITAVAAELARIPG